MHCRALQCHGVFQLLLISIKIHDDILLRLIQSLYNIHITFPLVIRHTEPAALCMCMIVYCVTYTELRSVYDMDLAGISLLMDTPCNMKLRASQIMC